MRLWLARHARVPAGEGLCYGRLDLAADVHETERAARDLALVLPAGVRLLTSPLRRCLQLAQTLTGLRADLAAEMQPRLAEMDFGAWEGRAWNAIGRDELDAWTADFGRYRAGGSGESASAFVARVAAQLDDSRRGGEDQVWVTHAGVFKAVTLWRDGLGLKAATDWPVHALACGSWHLFELPA